MPRRIRLILDICIFAGLATGAIISALALLGAFVPILDVINHFQLVIMTLGLIALAMSFVWPSTLLALKRFGRWLVLFILCCSAIILLPEYFHRQSFFKADAALSENGSVTPLKLMSFNIYMGTRDKQALADTILSANPDVAALQEYAPKRFRNQPDLKKAYPFQARCQSWRICTLAIYSKHKLTDIKSYDIGTQAQRNPMHGKLLAATVHPAGARAFRLYSVHLAWPLPLAEKQGQLATLSRIIDEERKQWPLQVIAGDFNSTGWAFRVDAFAEQAGLERRDHFVPTFPSPNSVIKHLRLPAFLSLDHILTSATIETASVERFSAPIGDHWPIMTTLYMPH
nr:endonuclease/exonuclease/phosphatase family protein [uncultured Cohaesibacter sp.]